MELTKENRKARKIIRSFIDHANLHGHISAFPIRVSFKSSSYMDGSWGHVNLRGSEKNKYLELAINEEYMKTSHGRELCMVISVHELAHAFTWASDEKVEEAKTEKYGDHGPEFGVVYAQLWTDLMDQFEIPGFDYTEDENNVNEN